MNRKRIAVLGLYRSSSTVVAGVLHHLGVDMGAPFYGGYYESEWLSKQLRRWWDEAHLPHLREKAPQAKRVRILTEWIQKRERAGAEWVGMKHPLLSLCGEDPVKAWGEETKFIRCCRPLDESVESMRRGMGFYNNPELAAGTLFAALDHFFAHRPCLEITFADMMKNPAGEIRRLIQFLEITPDESHLAAALQFVEPGRPAKVETEGKKAHVTKARRLGNLFKAMGRAVTFRGK